MNPRLNFHPDFRLTVSKHNGWLRLVGVITICLLAGALTGCVNHATEYSLGGGVSIRVPVPRGFEPLGDRNPRLRSLIEGTVSKNKKNILVEYYLTNAEMNELVSGNYKEREKDLTLYASLGAISNQQFVQIGNEISKKYHEGASPIVRSEYQGRPNNTEQVNVTRPLGIFLHTPDAVGWSAVNHGLMAGGAEISVQVLVIMHVRGRIVFAVVGTLGGRQSDILWAQQVGKQWSRAILEANR